MPGAAMGIVVAALAAWQRDTGDVGDAVQLEGMTPISTRLGRKRKGPRGRTMTSSLMLQVDKPHEHERAGVAVPERSVALLDDHRSTDSGWS